MDFEKIIRETVRSIFAEYDLRQQLYIKNIHKNIDHLITKADDWFGDKVPDDYKKVINSLLNLTFISLESEHDFFKSLTKTTIKNFSPLPVIRDLQNQFGRLYDINNFKLVYDESNNYNIHSSEEILTSSLSTIFLSVAQFMQLDSRCEIRLDENSSNIIIKMRFTKLSENLPDINKIMRSLFSYRDSSDYHVGMGMLLAIDNLRKSGAQVNMTTNISFDKEINITILFPSLKFLQMLDEIRETPIEDSKSDKGEIYVSVNDITIQMILQELLQDKGYKVDHIKNMFHSLSSKNCDGICIKALIIDYQNIVNFFQDPAYFIFATKVIEKVIVIYENESDISIFPLNNTILFYKMPIDINEMIDRIEGNGSEQEDL